MWIKKIFKIKTILIINLVYVYYSINKRIISSNNNINIIQKENEAQNGIKSNKINNRINDLRYHFQENIENRKLFTINYNFKPYTKIDKNLNFEENAIYIYNTTGMLNITKLELYYQSNKSNIKISLLNNIHISMSFNKNYIDLSLVSIASILNTSNNDTYIHFHILGLNFGIEEIKKIIELRRINNRVNFIFYNAKQAEYDFQIGVKDYRGVGNYAKLLIPEIINNTNKILIIDGGDTLCQKDLSELYFYDIGDNYFGWVMDQCAGNEFFKDDKFMTNYFHPNTGVMLVNIILYKRDDLYKKAIFMSKSYKSFKCPTQDILITIAGYKFKYIPLKYNIHIYYKSEIEKKKRIKSKSILGFLNSHKFNPYGYNIDEIYEAMDNPVIYHFYTHKMHKMKECDKMVILWINYAKLAGVYEILKVRFPFQFKCENKIK